jgi:putative molybdopterin biosynthesis protein
MNDDLLTTQEVADLLKVKKSTVYEMIKRGEIPSHKIGKQLRIAQRDIGRLLDWQERAAPIPQQTVRAPAAREGIILCGQDISLDIIANYISTVPKVPNILRSHAGSYNGLYLLYQGKADIATAHLWDEKSGTYNLPYIERLLPGLPAVVIRLFGRMTGIYVKAGNPKHITGWEDLRRNDISLVNRERGSGTRVLLDEKLKAMHINRFSVAGYENEWTSHLSVAGAVARGEGDWGFGIGRFAQQAQGIEFIPLQKEWYDMVFLAEPADDTPYRAIVDFVSSEHFMMEIAQIGDYDFSQTGRIIRT